MKKILKKLFPVKIKSPLLEFIFNNNTLLFIGITALVSLVSLSIISLFHFNENTLITIDNSYKILSILFIMVSCFILVLVQQNLNFIKNKVENNYTLRSFKSGDDFDEYLKFRLKSADLLRVIHFSSTVSDKRGSYTDIIDDFVGKQGKTFKRIIAYSEETQVLQWNYNEIKKHENSNYLIFYLDKIKIDKNMRTMGVMIIDEDEVCLGGGYMNIHKHPTIAIQNKNIAEFHSIYFNHLLSFAAPVRFSDGKVNWQFFRNKGIPQTTPNNPES